jgi:hypothetical protein
MVLVPNWGAGKVTQPWVKGLPVVFGSANEPLERTLALLKVCPYTVTGNGNVIRVTQSSQWFPVSVTPGTIVFPVVVLVKYVHGPAVGDGVGVDVGVAVAVAVAVAVGVGVGVRVAVGVGVGVNVAVAVAVAVAVGVSVGVNVGVGVGVGVC